MKSTVMAESSPPTATTPNRTDIRRSSRFAAAAIWAVPAVVTFAVCLFRANRPALWTDELATWTAANRSVGELFDMLRNVDAVLGGYYLFMHFWITVFGDSELSLRAPSILAMAMSAGLLAALTRRLLSSSAPDGGAANTTAARGGLAAGLLFAAIPMVSRYGQEARVYAIVIMLAIAATYVFVAALERPRWVTWIGYALLVAALGYAHAVALTLLLAHGVEVGRRWYIGRSMGRAGLRPVLSWLGAAAVGVAVAAPVLWWGLDQKYQVSWNATPRWLGIFELPNDLFGAGIAAGFVLALAVWAAVSGLLRSWTVLLVTWAVLPTTVIFLLARTEAIWNPRYLFFVMPAFVVLAGGSLAQLRWRPLAIVGLVFCALVATQQVEIRRADAHAQMDGRAVAAVIEPQLRPGDVVIYSTVDVWAPRTTVDYYVDPRPADVLARGSAADNNAFVPAECADVASCVADAPRIWLVRWGRYADDPYRYLDAPKAQLLRDSYSQTNLWSIGELTVVLFTHR